MTRTVLALAALLALPAPASATTCPPASIGVAWVGLSSDPVPMLPTDTADLVDATLEDGRAGRWCGTATLTVHDRTWSTLTAAVSGLPGLWLAWVPAIDGGSCGGGWGFSLEADTARPTPGDSRWALLSVACLDRYNAAWLATHELVHMLGGVCCGRGDEQGHTDAGLMGTVPNQTGTRSSWWQPGNLWAGPGNVAESPYLSGTRLERLQACRTFMCRR